MTRAGQRRDRHSLHGRGRNGAPNRCSFCRPRRRGPGLRRCRSPGHLPAAPPPGPEAHAWHCGGGRRGSGGGGGRAVGGGRVGRGAWSAALGLDADRHHARVVADAPLAAWSLLAGGVVSAAAGALVMAGGGLASGNVLAAAVTVPGGVLAAAVLVVVAASAWRPGLRGALQRPAAWALRGGSRLARRPVADPGQVIRAWAGRLGELQLSLAGWAMVIVLAVGNWLAGAAVLAVGILSVGGRGALARSAAGLWRGDCRAELLRHPRRARRHRGNAQPGADRRRDAGQPGAGRGAALPPGQFLAGCPSRAAGAGRRGCRRPGSPRGRRRPCR